MDKTEFTIGFWIMIKIRLVLALLWEAVRKRWTRFDFVKEKDKDYLNVFFNGEILVKIPYKTEKEDDGRGESDRV